ncbi:hypothetical protein ACEQ8H_001455 [Pleosporales sp. CAS-2024a]
MAPTTSKTATAKATKSDEGVKKGGKAGGKKNNARTAMAKMQAFFKENRSKYKDLGFKDQQKELGKEWKASSENPKNAA